MNDIRIVNAGKTHCRTLLSQKLRTLDVMEWESGTGQPARSTFRQAYLDPQCMVLRALLVDHNTVAVWGVHRTDEIGIGSLWMLGVEDVKVDFRPAFFTMWRDEIALLHARSLPTLMALADDRNKQHHRWLRTMGFTALAEPHIAEDQTPFTTYVRSQP